jgi:hypothetical protein
MLATQGRWTFSTRYHELQRSASYGVRIVPLSPFQLDVTDLDFTDACQATHSEQVGGFSWFPITFQDPERESG